jgi:hypothetical protein
MKHYPELTLDDMLNMWLVPFFGTTIEEVTKNWEGEPNSREFYRKYAVTQEQHDMWYSWAIFALSKQYRLSKKRMEWDFCFSYLNCAPQVKKNNNG